jgi:hypothetical protein
MGAKTGTVQTETLYPKLGREVFSQFAGTESPREEDAALGDEMLQWET